MRTAIKAIDLKSMEANLHLDNKRHMQQKMRTHNRVAPAGVSPLLSIDLKKFDGGLTYKSDQKARCLVTSPDVNREKPFSLRFVIKRIYFYYK